jgi:hypothetical protein
VFDGNQKPGPPLETKNRHCGKILPFCETAIIRAEGAEKLAVLIYQKPETVL